MDSISSSLAMHSRIMIKKTVMLTRQFRGFLTFLFTIATVLVIAQFVLHIITKGNYKAHFVPLFNETQLSVPRAFGRHTIIQKQRKYETYATAARTYTRMKFGPVFILGVVGGNLSANSSWDHFRIYGMLDRKYYKRRMLSCCLLYRENEEDVTVKIEPMKQKMFEYPAEMWSFHVSCSNVKHAQDQVPVGLAVTLRNIRDCSKGHVVYVPPHFPAKDPGQIVIGSKLAYGSIDAEQIIEWVEAMRYIGVDKIVTYYLRSLNTDALNVLCHYASKGFVDLFSHEPANEETYRRVDNFTAGAHQTWNDQQSIVYDSFERYSGCRYFAIIDQDEFFIPGKYRTLGGMFDHLEQKHFDAAGFVVRTQFYFLSWGKRSNASDTILGSYLLREDHKPRFERRKNFIVPARTRPGGLNTHNFWPAEGFKMYQLPADEGYIRHFRYDCRRENYVECMTNWSRVEDTSVSEWAEGFNDKVARVRKNVLGL